VSAAGTRSAALLVLVAVLLALGAAPAFADPAGPTNYEAVVTAVETADGAQVDVEARTLGGDAFLVLSAPEGATVEVPGYDDEPYVRISEDGTVEVNHRSPTHWFNEDRYGAAVPEVADEDAEPVWRTVADDGTYAWHEHRIHWMSPSPPRQVDTGLAEPQHVFDWEIPVVVDGDEALVRGDLTWHPGPASWVPTALLIAAAVLAVGLVLGLGVPAAVLSLVGAVPALAAGILQVTGLPTGGEGDLFVAVLPGLAVLVGGGGLVLSRREPGSMRGSLIGASAGLPLLVWGVLQSGALTRPIVPEPLTAPVLRVIVALALACGAMGLALLAREGIRAMPDSLDAVSHEDETVGGSAGRPDRGRG
jgi:hypothetical protein